MSLDTEDGPPGAVPPPGSAGEAPEDAPTTEDLLEEEAQDFRLFASMFQKKNSVSAQTLRKGEKDFESHGTRAQENALEQSRKAMEEVLSYTRVHKAQGWIRGWYFPDWWAERPEDALGDWEGTSVRRTDPGSEKRWPENARDRVVVLEHSGGPTTNYGRAIPGQSKDTPARGLDWLLPEEALFLVSRGSLDLWWPLRELEEIFPAKKDSPDQQGAEEKTSPNPEEDDEYGSGIPLSLEAAYALLIGNDGERGKVSLQKYHVYSSLKRAGYNLFRAPPFHKSPAGPAPTASTSIWPWLHSILSSEKQPGHLPYGPLVQPGLYRSYQSIYRRLAVVPRHKPNPQPSSSWQAREPFRVHYYVWKPSTSWSKTHPPHPDYFMAVVDAQESDVPDLEEIAALLDTTSWAPPKAEWVGPGRIYPRLKHGHRNVLVAVVDHSVINYMRFSESAFGEEPQFPRFDIKQGQGGSKRGGKGFRGGRGGRGRGRGRHRA